MKEELTESEFKEMLSLLKRFSETGIDQWEFFKFINENGTFYIDIVRVPGYDEDNYTDVTKLIEEYEKGKLSK